MRESKDKEREKGEIKGILEIDRERERERIRIRKE